MERSWRNSLQERNAFLSSPSLARRILGKDERPCGIALRISVVAVVAEATPRLLPYRWSPESREADGSTARPVRAPAPSIDYRRWRQSQRENQYRNLAGVVSLLSMRNFLRTKLPREAWVVSTSLFHLFSASRVHPANIASSSWSSVKDYDVVPLVRVHRSISSRSSAVSAAAAWRRGSLLPEEQVHDCDQRETSAWRW